jgi:hypothetical protein
MVILELVTDLPPANNYVAVDGENYLLLELQDYGLDEQGCKWRLDNATNALLSNPSPKAGETARNCLDEMIKAIVPSLPMEKIKALAEGPKITLMNTYQADWEVYSNNPKLHKPVSTDVPEQAGQAVEQVDAQPEPVSIKKATKKAKGSPAA